MDISEVDTCDLIAELSKRREHVKILGVPLNEAIDIIRENKSHQHNRTFKVVGNYKSGLQACKRTYTSYKDFKRYTPDLLRRWRTYYPDYIIETFELINEEWICITNDII